MSDRGSSVLSAAEEWPGRDRAEPVTPKKKKSKASSLRRAFSWLRARRKKKKKKKQQQQQDGGGGKAKDTVGTNPEDDQKLSVQYKANNGQQDNVFFPSVHLPHLEEIHIQAQQGLKSLQHQEKQKQNRHGPEPADNDSLQSDMFLADSDSFRSRAQSCTTDTASDDVLSVRSEMIQRIGSTFRPHDAAKPSVKPGKKRKERRTTVAGVPQHIQKELGLSKNRASRLGVMDLFPRDGGLKDELTCRKGASKPALLVNSNGKLNPEVVYIPTINGDMQSVGTPKEEGTRISLRTLEASSATKDMDSDSTLQQHIEKVYYDDTFLGRKTSLKLSPLARPKSLAVPGMTTNTGHSELMSPVMSISPQGTYMSKIIPNAILPPLVDVIALSRNSVRTLSRCSLSTASPASLRHCYSHQHSSSSETWSHSQSTETIMSNTSTISSQGGSGAIVIGQTGPKDSRVPEPAADQVSLSSSVNSRVNGCVTPNSLGLPVVPSETRGRVSPAYSVSSTVDSSDTMSITSDRSSIRSVSLRKSKKPPAPPKRSYSLQKQKELGLPPQPEQHKFNTTATGKGGDPWVQWQENHSPVEGEEVFLPGSLKEKSQGYSAAVQTLGNNQSTSSPISARLLRQRNEITAKDAQLSSSAASEQTDNSPGRSERTMSPSSGYSSQSGTPTLPTKGLINYPSSPLNRKSQPVKPARLGSLRSTDVSVSSSLTSLSSSTSDSVPQEAATTTTKAQSISPVSAAPVPSGSTSTVSSSKAELLARFVIPPHPKVPAPLCPPPSKPRHKILALPASAASICVNPSPSIPIPASAASSTVPAHTISILHQPNSSKAGEEPSALMRVSNSPPPSPPPSHHPPPPQPVKNIDSPTNDLVSSSGLSTAASDPLWPLPPPPPPLALCEPDLSMADFPPPDDVDFSALPPPPPIQSEATTSLLSAVPQESAAVAPLQSTGTFSSAAVSHSTGTSLSFSAKVSSRIHQQTPSNSSYIQSEMGQAVQSKPSLVPTSSPVSVTRKPLPSALVVPLPTEASPVDPTTITPPLTSEEPDASVVHVAVSSPANAELHQSCQKTESISGTNSKTEAVCQGKRNPVQKEDASLPLVTPSLLQMVRLRSVHLETNRQLTDQTRPVENGDMKSGHSVPQKPIRKSLSLRSPPAKDTVPSTPPPDAVSLKASTFSPKETQGPPVTPSEKASEASLTVLGHTISSSESVEIKDGQTSPIHKSPASTASFIFAKSPKKIVIESSSAPEAHADLKKNLVAELMSYSGPRTATPVIKQQASAGKPQVQRKPSKVPPPVARKPSQGQPWSPSSSQPQPDLFVPDAKTKPSSQEEARTPQGCSVYTDTMVENGRATQLAGQEPLPQSHPAQEKQKVEDAGH
ncbi:NHS-like protein 3 [Microcaecilia unicolor]|uniref:Uncharacterized protein KIAA1522 homolog n=1 Tax=Microcaecilia unicolor TaxID=1415580 RepID=A0A6P7ZDW0_9AMPH|nr:uncharacterized protein KIAA1522 homolog [Microcaecilia unicolor]